MFSFPKHPIEIFSMQQIFLLFWRHYLQIFWSLPLLPELSLFHWVPFSLLFCWVIYFTGWLVGWLVAFCFYFSFHLSSSLPVEGLPQMPSYPGLSISFLSVKHQKFCVKHYKPRHRLNLGVLFGVMKGHAILVNEKLLTSVPGNIFSGATSFLHKMIFQSDAREIQEQDICLDAGLPWQ